MGLTLYYDWETKTDLSSARRMIARFRAIALRLPFDEVSEICEQDPPDNMPTFRKYDASFRQGGLYLCRTRADGDEETVQVPAARIILPGARQGRGDGVDWVGDSSAGRA